MIAQSKNTIVWNKDSEEYSKQQIRLVNKKAP